MDKRVVDQDEIILDSIEIIQGIPAYKPGIALAVRRDICLTLERESLGDFSRAFRETVERLESIYPEIVPIRLTDGINYIVGQGTSGREIRPVDMHRGTVIAVQSIVRSHPHKIRIVLENRKNGTVGQPVGVSDPSEDILPAIVGSISREDRDKYIQNRQQKRIQSFIHKIKAIRYAKGANTNLHKNLF
jgi:hypothetical protein